MIQCDIDSRSNFCSSCVSYACNIAQSWRTVFGHVCELEFKIKVYDALDGSRYVCVAVNGAFNLCVCLNRAEGIEYDDICEHSSTKCV